MTANPNWYEILDVAPTATAAQIKSAWQSAVADLPGAGAQLRMLNAAAEVLLDPEKRGAYDAELAALAAAEPTAEPTMEPTTEPTAEPAVVPAPAAGADSRPAAPAPSGILALLGSWWALGASALLAAAVIALTVVLGVGLQHQVTEARQRGEAMSAAERALAVVTAYDYRQLEADRDRALQFLTPKYQKELTKTFDLLIVGADGKPGPAVQTKTVVTSEVADVGVVDSELDRVRVLVFLDQTSVKEGGDPAILQNRVVATMVKRDGTWLIDHLETT